MADDQDDAIPDRATTAAQEAIFVLLDIAANLAQAYPNRPSGDVANAVQEAFEEIGDTEDREALEATAGAKLAGHDPETRS